MSDTLSALTLKTFQDLQGASFSLRVGEQSVVEVRLEEVHALGFNTPEAKGGQASFSLIFLAPTLKQLQQGIYPLHHTVIGEQSLFLVPLSAKAEGMRLEAVFNFA